MKYSMKYSMKKCNNCKTKKHNYSHNCSGVTKKHNYSNNFKKYSLINNNLTRIKRIKNITNITKKHTGGMFGLKYIEFQWNMHKFNKMIDKLNKFDKKIQDDIDSYKIQAKTFEMRAQDKAEIQTEIINNYRQKIIILIYQKDEIETPEKKQSIKIMINDSIKTVDDHLTSLGERKIQLDKEMGKDIPEYLRLMKSFKIKTEKFNKLTEEYAKNSKFYQEIKEMKRSYDIILDGKKSENGLSKSDKKKISKFKQNKSKYDKVLNLSDSEFQNRKNIEQDIANLLKTAEYFKDQIGEYKGKVKIKSGMLDSQMYDVNCIGGSGLLCEWYEKYTEFAELLLEINPMCDESIEKLKIIAQCIDNSIINLNVVITNYKTDPHPEALLRFKTDIMELLSMFELIKKSILSLKAEFYKQTPATRLIYDYNEIGVNLNFIESKLGEYNKIFKDIKEIEEQQKEEKTISGGFMFNTNSKYRVPVNNTQYGGSKSIPRRGKGQHKGFKHNKTVSFASGVHSSTPSGHSHKSNPSGHIHKPKSGGPSYKLGFSGAPRNPTLKQASTKQYKHTQHHDNTSIINILCSAITNKDFFNNFKRENFIKIVNLNIHINGVSEDDKNRIKDINIFCKNIYNIYMFFITVFLKHNTTHNTDDIIKNLTYLLDIYTTFDNYKNLITNIHTKLEAFYTKDIKFIYNLLIPIPMQQQTIYQSINDTNTANLLKIQDIEILKKYVNNKINDNNPFVFNDFNNTYINKDTPAETGAAQGTNPVQHLTQTQQVKPTLTKESIENLQTILGNNNNLFNYSIKTELGKSLDLLLNIYNHKKEKDIKFNDTTQLTKMFDIINNIINSKDVSKDVSTTENDISNYNEYLEKYIDNVLKPLEYLQNKTITITEDIIKQIDDAKGVGLQIETIINAEENKHINPETTPTTETKRKPLNDNLIQDVIKRIKAAKHYDIQEANIINEFTTIKELLIELVGDKDINPIKTLSNTIQNLLKLLSDIKVIEPKIVSIKVKENKAIDIPLAKWIVDATSTDFDKYGKLQLTDELQALRFKNKDQKIYTDGSQASSKEEEELFVALIFGSNNNIDKITREPKYIQMLTTVAILTRIVEKLKHQIPPPQKIEQPQDKQDKQQYNFNDIKRMCNILIQIKGIIGYKDTEKAPRDLIDATIKEYSADKKCSYQKDNTQKQDKQHWKH